MSKNRNENRREEEGERKAWIRRHAAYGSAKTRAVKFYDVTLTFGGSLFSMRQCDSSSVDRESVALFTRMFMTRERVDITVPLPVMDLSVHWTSMKGTAAIASFLWRGIPVTTSALLSGIDLAEDRIVAEALQELVLRLCGGTAFEPSFYLLNANERPLLATYIVPPLVTPRVVTTVSDAETCLAAAFFEKVLGRRDQS